MRIFIFICLSVFVVGCTIPVKESAFFRSQNGDGLTMSWSFTDDNGLVLQGESARRSIFDQLSISKQNHQLLSPTGSLEVVHYQQDDPNKPLILYCGGSGFDAELHGDLVAFSLESMGDVFMWNYPRTGLSEGKPRYETIQTASSVIINSIQRFVRPNQDVVLWGYSLGGFVCADMVAQEISSKALILEATAPTMSEGVKAFSKRLFGGFVKFKLADETQDLNIVEAIGGANIPILVMGASKDNVLRVELSQTLYSRLKKNGLDATYIEYTGANHFSIPLQEDFKKDVSAFLNKSLPELKNGIEYD